MSATLHTDDPLLEWSADGTVSLSFDGGESWTRFRTVAAFHQAIEDIDRLVVAHDHGKREAYFRRMAELRAERDALR